MDSTYKEIGELIRSYREKQDLTQLDLARSLGYSASQFVSLFERGLSKVPPNILGVLVVKLKLPEKKIKQMLIKDFMDELDTKINEGKKSASSKEVMTNV